MSFKKLTLSTKAQITVGTPTAHIYGFEILIGIGTGMFIQAGYAVIQAVVDPVDMGYAISFMMIGMILCPFLLHTLQIYQRCPLTNPNFTSAQLGGIALGLSISGAVFINRAQIALTAVLPNVPADQITQAISGTSGTFFSKLPDGTREKALNALVNALRKV